MTGYCDEESNILQLEREKIDRNNSSFKYGLAGLYTLLFGIIFA